MGREHADEGLYVGRLTRTAYSQIAHTYGGYVDGIGGQHMFVVEQVAQPYRGGVYAAERRGEKIGPSHGMMGYGLRVMGYGLWVIGS